MARTFELTAEQEKLFEEFRKKKEKERRKANKRDAAIGGAFTFCFTPTSIGTSLEVVCNDDKSKLDLTDYDNW